MDDFKELALILCVGVAIFFCLGVLPLSYYEKWKCGNFEEVTGRDTKYIHFDACYVKSQDGEWIRYDDKFKY